MTINENSLEYDDRFVDHDGYIKDAIENVFQQPEESCEMLQELLMGSCDELQAENSNGFPVENITSDIYTNETWDGLLKKSSDVCTAKNSSYNSTADDLEELILDENEEDNSFSQFDELPDISFLKIDNFVETTEKRQPTAIATNDTAPKHSKHVICEINSEPEFDNKVFSDYHGNSNHSEARFPEVVFLNSIMSCDPLPGEASDSHVTDCSNELNTDASVSLPLLAKTFHVENGDSKDEVVNPVCDPVEPYCDSVVPFVIDESHDYDNYTHIPKFGQEIKNILLSKNK